MKKLISKKKGIKEYTITLQLNTPDEKTRAYHTAALYFYPARYNNLVSLPAIAAAICYMRFQFSSRENDENEFMR